MGLAALFSSQTTTTTPEEPVKSHSRRLSKRMSMSRRIGPPLRHTSSISGKIFTGSAGAWEQALFEPFVDIQSDYELLEKRFLEQCLLLVHDKSSNSAESLSGGSLSAMIFQEQSGDVFAIAEESITRCHGPYAWLWCGRATTIPGSSFYHVFEYFTFGASGQFNYFILHPWNARPR